MTIESSEKFDIKSVAVIGAGPAGIAALYELSRTTKDGKTLFGEKDVSKYEEAGELAFPRLVVFERNAGVGGVWDKTSYIENNTDPDYPDFEGAAEDDNLDVSNPDEIFQSTPFPKELESELETSSLENPVKVPFTKDTASIVRNQWRSSGAYAGLFTNVTNRFMQFSFEERIGEELKEINTRYKHLPDLQAFSDVSDYLVRAVKNNNLEKYIRLNTNVEKVTKLPNGKWDVTVSFITTEDNGTKSFNWYKQTFDAVIIGNGKTVPIIPKIKNLVKFAEVNKDKVSFKLAKSVRDPKFITKGKKILFVGSSVSTVDLLQYAFPRDLDTPTIYVSRKSPTANMAWLTLCSHSRGIINKPTIDEFLPESNSVKFSDGTVESDFDIIVIGTGYHTFYPFFDKSYVKKTPNIFNFYKWTFSIADRTLALIGNTYAFYLFNRSEAQSAALVGVWTNTSKLPSVEEQIKDNEVKPELVSTSIDEMFIRPLLKYALPGRPHPFEVNPEKRDHVYFTSIGMNTLLDVFFKVRNGEVKPTELLALND